MGRPMGSSNSTPPPAHPLLDRIRAEYAPNSDGQLCEFLGVKRSTVSKIRHGINGVSAEFVLRVHKATGWSIHRIEKLL
jgi:plasmid maintenance system antidote protein VapI